METLSASASPASAGLRSRSLAAALVLVLCAAPGASRGYEPRGEYQVKGAFLLHFARLVEWPPSGPEPGSGRAPFVIGIFGPQEVIPEIEEARVGARPVVLRRLREAQHVRDCQIVFVTEAAHADTREILAAARGHAVLTVGESGGFLDEGGMIRFFEEGRKVRFEIDPGAASLAGLRISSRLLRLARLREAP